MGTQVIYNTFVSNRLNITNGWHLNNVEPVFFFECWRLQWGKKRLSFVACWVIEKWDLLYHAVHLPLMLERAPQAWLNVSEAEWVYDMEDRCFGGSLDCLLCFQHDKVMGLQADGTETTEVQSIKAVKSLFVCGCTVRYRKIRWVLKALVSKHVLYLTS